MNKSSLLVLAVLIVGGLTATVLLRKARNPQLSLRALVGGLVGLNGLVGLLVLGLLAFSLGTPTSVLAQGAAASTTTSSTADPFMGAALATGLACIGAGIAVGIAGAAAIGGITEKPEILGRSLIFVGLAEGIAIYGLIISFMILNS